jgi:hypothetical protein
MFKYKAQNKAQMVPEYAFLIAVVVASIVAMSILLKRALQARIKDSRNAMLLQVDNLYQSLPRAANELTPAYIDADYEPYYANTESQIIRDADNQKQLFLGGRSGIAKSTFNETTAAQTNSTQLSPGY